jgi:hypothetical protein
MFFDLFSPSILQPVLNKAVRSPSRRDKNPAIDIMRLSPVEGGSELERLVHEALRRAGFLVQLYSNPINRFEYVAGLSFEDYLASRSSNRRYNIRRRQRKMEKAGRLQIDLYADDTPQEALQQGLDDFVLATAESWKSPASLVSRPALQLMRLAASEGALRMGVLKFDGRPIAGQFWVVAGGIGHCMRRAYHEDFKKWGAGVVLTAHMLARSVVVHRNVRRRFERHGLI